MKKVEISIAQAYNGVPESWNKLKWPRLKKMFVSKKHRKNFTPKSNEQFFSQTHMGASYACQICDTPIQVLLLKHVFLRCLKKKYNQWSLVEAVWFENSDRILIEIALLKNFDGRNQMVLEFFKNSSDNSAHKSSR